MVLVSKRRRGLQFLKAIQLFQIHPLDILLGASSFNGRFDTAGRIYQRYFGSKGLQNIFRPFLPPPSKWQALTTRGGALVNLLSHNWSRFYIYRAQQHALPNPQTPNGAGHVAPINNDVTTFVWRTRQGVTCHFEASLARSQGVLVYHTPFGTWAGEFFKWNHLNNDFWFTYKTSRIQK